MKGERPFIKPVWQNKKRHDVFGLILFIFATTEQTIEKKELWVLKEEFNEEIRSLESSLPHEDYQRFRSQVSKVEKAILIWLVNSNMSNYMKNNIDFDWGEFGLKI